MPPVRYWRPIVKRRIPLSPTSLGSEPAFQTSAQSSAFAPIPTPTLGLASGIPQVKLFNEFMRTFINKVQVPAKALDNSDRLLEFRNPELYYSHLHMEYYYFCQQFEDHFEVAGSLGHKRVSFATGFLKDYILN